MLTHLVIFRSAMVRQTYDLPDAFRARPRDFVLISEPRSPGPGIYRSEIQWVVSHGRHVKARGRAA